MNVAISTSRQAHYRLPANSLLRRGHDVTLYTSTSNARLKDFDPRLRTKLVPAPITIVNALTRLPIPVSLNEVDCVLYDRLSAFALKPCDFFLGASSSSLETGRAAQKHGAAFVLDRACPDIRVQQNLMIEEMRKLGGNYNAHSPWFLERQVAEYEAADFILSPSNYSRSSFPEHIRRKVILAPLYGRSRVVPRQPRPAGSTFVVGVVGGQPLRKGYIYLLEAWKELALPNAELHIRSSADFAAFPALEKLVASQPSVKRIPYVPDISAFYAGCDAFILPSIDDGFGMALFEAVANGVPSIATRNCGASELLTAGQDALVIDPFSVSAIKDALELLYTSAETRDRLSHHGPLAVAALQEGEKAKPYEEGLDRLLASVAARRLSTAAA